MAAPPPTPDSCALAIRNFTPQTPGPTLASEIQSPSSFDTVTISGALTTPTYSKSYQVAKFSGRRSCDIPTRDTPMWAAPVHNTKLVHFRFRGMGWEGESGIKRHR
ncbi:hypothetical protein CROQUDRAFT_98169 [Cronartium quercuum f. sp. fusiforme G11]|uniref:Uncharacterized protein n=1 Tax=Cronartium quercuum f. sp. fusiforme G11 TaxID=708437 RepID=A0A9P6N8K3_9BASI|nr:hypothetical protein CROQUDRAFT_98169 [Cronartium quercuum f. sp. fusiforme G11]